VSNHRGGGSPPCSRSSLSGRALGVLAGAVLSGDHPRTASWKPAADSCRACTTVVPWRTQGLTARAQGLVLGRANAMLVFRAERNAVPDAPRPPRRRDREENLPDSHLRARMRADRFHLQPVPDQGRAAAYLPTGRGRCSGWSARRCQADGPEDLRWITSVSLEATSGGDERVPRSARAAEVATGHGLHGVVERSADRPPPPLADGEVSIWGAGRVRHLDTPTSRTAGTPAAFEETPRPCSAATVPAIWRRAWLTSGDLVGPATRRSRMFHATSLTPNTHPPSGDSPHWPRTPP